MTDPLQLTGHLHIRMDRQRCSISVPLPQRPPKRARSELPKKGAALVPRARLRLHKLSRRSNTAPRRPALARYASRLLNNPAPAIVRERALTPHPLADERYFVVRKAALEDAHHVPAVQQGVVPPAEEGMRVLRLPRRQDA